MVLNPAPFRAVPDEMVAAASYITPNQTEAQSLLGKNADPQILCKELTAKYGNTVILTAGKHGAFIMEDGEAVAIPVPEVTVKDTTGAGDCFNAALTVALAEGRDFAMPSPLPMRQQAFRFRFRGLLNPCPSGTRSKIS